MKAFVRWVAELPIQEGYSAMVQRATEFWASGVSPIFRWPMVCPVIFLWSLQGASCGG